MQIVPRLNLLPQEFRPYYKLRPDTSRLLIIPLAVRIWSRINMLGPLWNGTHCWEWTSAVNSEGYAQFRGLNSTQLIKLHKWFWEKKHGPVPYGFELDHLCRNKRCGNPDHLEAVSHRVNVLRGESPIAQNARRTHCKYGHDYSIEISSTGKKRRRCRICRDNKMARWHKKNYIPVSMRSDKSVRYLSSQDRLDILSNDCRFHALVRGIGRRRRK